MEIRSYADAVGFLKDAQAALEANEPAHSLMLGVCLRLAQRPHELNAQPCLKTAWDAKGLVLACMMTPPHKLAVTGLSGDEGAAARLLVRDVVGEGWEIPGVVGPRGLSGSVAAHWAEATGARYELERQMTLYAVRSVTMPAPASGRLRLATEADVEWLAGWRYQFWVEAFGRADAEGERRATEQAVEDGEMYLWEDPSPVCTATTVRPTRHGISVGMVYTPPAWRGRGYATACVGELSRSLLESGRGYCALFADTANAAANRAYQKIGYEPVLEFDEFKVIR